MNTSEIKVGTTIKVLRAGSTVASVYQVLAVHNNNGFAHIDVPASKKAYASDGQIKRVLVIDNVDRVEVAA